MPRWSVTSLVGVMLGALVAVAAPAQSQPTDLPDGAGKPLVESLCTACHRSDQITRSSGYTLEGWKELTSTMLDLSGNPETWDTINQYLVTHFPLPHQAGPYPAARRRTDCLQELEGAHAWPACPRSNPGS